MYVARTLHLASESHCSVQCRQSSQCPIVRNHQGPIVGQVAKLARSGNPQRVARQTATPTTAVLITIHGTRRRLPQQPRQAIEKLRVRHRRFGQHAVHPLHPEPPLDGAHGPPALLPRILARGWPRCARGARVSRRRPGTAARSMPAPSRIQPRSVTFGRRQAASDSTTAVSGSRAGSRSCCCGDVSSSSSVAAVAPPPMPLIPPVAPKRRKTRDSNTSGPGAV